MANPDGNLLHAVYHVVYEDLDDDRPSEDDLRLWSEQLGLVNNVMSADGDAALDAFEKRECAFIVETATMRIVWRQCTCADGSSCVSSVETGLRELDLLF